MASVNRATILGNLGRDVETRYTPNGEAVANFSVATTEKWTDKSGEKKEETQWHNIVAFGRVAEIAAEYLHKGSPVYIDGKIKTRKYTDKQGVEKSVTEIHVGPFGLQLLGSRPSESEDKPAAKRPEKPKSDGAAKNTVDDFSDDIPF
jgi:single-strand DNA-binding protein